MNHLKHIFAISTPILLLAACNHGKTTATDTAAIDTAMAEEAAELAHTYYLTKDSLGPVKVGMLRDSVAPAVTWLYDQITREETPDALEYDFVDGNSVSFSALDFGENRLDVIMLSDTLVGVETPQGVLKLHMPFTAVLDLPGVTTEWSGYDGEGSWYWRWQGLWFAPGENISESLSQRLFNSTQAPTHVDFSGNETIGFIGTGLPY